MSPNKSKERSSFSRLVIPVVKYELEQRRVEPAPLRQCGRQRLKEVGGDEADGNGGLRRERGQRGRDKRDGSNRRVLLLFVMFFDNLPG